MSKTGALIAMVVMLALAAAAWFALPRRPGPAGGSTSAATAPILDFSPSDVAELILEGADGTRESVFRTADGWRLRAPDSDNADALSWPIAGAQARGVLTILHNLTPVAPAHGESFGADALTIRIRLNDNTEQQLRFDTRSIGGRRLVQADDATPVYLDKPVYEALTSPGPMGWREKTLLRGVGAGVSRLTIESARGRLKLARLRGVWRLRQPVHAAVDESAVDQLMAALSAMTVVRWIDDASEHAGVDVAGFPQALRVTIERDRRSVDKAGVSHVTTDSTLITIGGSADVAGDERYVSIGSDELVATVSADQVEAIHVDPTMYVSKTAIAVDRSQIGAIEITRPNDEAAAATVTRTLDGWRLEHSASAGRILPDEQVRALLDLLTQEPANSVSLANADSEGDARSTNLLIQVFGFNHDLLEEVHLATTQAGLALISDGLVRRYHNAESPELLSVVMESTDTSG